MKFNMELKTINIKDTNDEEYVPSFYDLINKLKNHPLCITYHNGKESNIEIDTIYSDCLLTKRGNIILFNGIRKAKIQTNV